MEIAINSNNWCIIFTNPIHREVLWQRKMSRHKKVSIGNINVTMTTVAVGNIYRGVMMTQSLSQRDQGLFQHLSMTCKQLI